MIDGVGADPYGTLILNHVQKKDGAKGTGGHFRIEIYGKKEDGITIQDKPIALLDDGPSAGVINAPIAGSTVTASSFSKDVVVAPKTDLEKEIGHLKEALAGVLVNAYMAELRNDVVEMKKQQLRADALETSLKLK